MCDVSVRLFDRSGSNGGDGGGGDGGDGSGVKVVVQME